jgi:hypothetical protein
MREEENYCCRRKVEMERGVFPHRFSEISIRFVRKIGVQNEQFLRAARVQPPGHPKPKEETRFQPQDEERGRKAEETSWEIGDSRSWEGVIGERRGQGESGEN